MSPLKQDPDRQAAPAADWIRKLGLEPHPEGGFFREVYRASRRLGGRACATHIFYLLRGAEISRLHRIRSDEAWHFYDGSPLCVRMIGPKGEGRTLKLGRDPRRRQKLFGIVPAGWWFGAHLEDPKPGAYALVGCTVSPGFEFGDLAFGSRSTLLKRFPRQAAVIRKLCPLSDSIRHR